MHDQTLSSRSKMFPPMEGHPAALISFKGITLADYGNGLVLEVGHPRNPEETRSVPLMRDELHVASVETVKSLGDYKTVIELHFEPQRRFTFPERSGISVQLDASPASDRDLFMIFLGVVNEYVNLEKAPHIAPRNPAMVVGEDLKRLLVVKSEEATAIHSPSRWVWYFSLQAMAQLSLPEQELQGSYNDHPVSDLSELYLHFDENKTPTGIHIAFDGSTRATAFFPYDNPIQTLRIYFTLMRIKRLLGREAGIVSTTFGAAPTYDPQSFGVPFHWLESGRLGTPVPDKSHDTDTAE